MDPLHLCIALGPIGVYLLLMATLNLSPRPFLTTGTRDTVALAIAVCGLVMAGPMELFMPEAAAVYFRAWIWIPLITLYLLCATLAAMLMRPRLVIYNVTVEHLRPLLERVASDLDDQRVWSGNSLRLPRLGIQLHLESFVPMRNVQLVAVGAEQDLAGWRALETRLRQELRDLVVGPNTMRGVSFLFFSLLIGFLVGTAMISGSQQVAQALHDFLRL